MMTFKRYFSPLVLVMAALTLMTSCLDKDEEVLDDACYISGVSLGNIKRTIYTTSASGKDSTYTVTIEGIRYPMTIDQRNLLIQNKDSLPYGANLGAVVVNVNYKGVLIYKLADEDEWLTYSSADSLDFTAPVQFAVMPTSGNGIRYYTMKLNAHKQDGDVFSWARFDDGQHADELASLTESNMAVLNDCVVLMGRNADGKVVNAIHARKYPISWAVSDTKGVDVQDADLSTLCTFGNMALMSNAKGEILKSYDGQTWELMFEAVAGRRLLGVSCNCIYTETDGSIACWNNAGGWQTNKLDTDNGILPENQVSLSYAESDNGYKRLVLVGNSAQSTDKKAEVWIKSWRSDDMEANAEWMYCPHMDGERTLCPQMEPLFTLPYNKGVIALGGKSKDGKCKSLESIFYSPNYGVTWSASTSLTTPRELRGTTESVAVTVDDENFIWIAAGKQLWRGRLNRLGFKNASK